MYEDYYQALTEEQKSAYFKRIGLEYSPNAKLSRQYLDEIIKAQLRHIPFDDADVWANGAWPSLAIPDLYHKIIEQKRGGYCYELNSLFCRLLKDLGFDAYLVIIHLYRPDIKFNAPAHCGVIVTIDGKKHFADVGYGGPVPDGCVAFGGEVENNHKQITDGVYTVVASKNSDGSFIPRFKFKDMPCDPVELVPLNFHTSQRPDTVFRHSLELNLRYDDGFAEVHNKKFKYKHNGEEFEKEFASKEEAAKAAQEVFGIPQSVFPVRDFEDR
ncbi:MAG: arylamine N-acetyltransferase [Bacillota bacterium]|nr:arylamine N-acetyltransferase [Bacillota bacterium]